VVGPFGGVCLAFDEHLTLVRRCLAYAWCHFELDSSFTLHSCIIAGAELHLILIAYPYCWIVLEASSANIRIASCAIRVLWMGFVCESFYLLGALVLCYAPR
jgi:hypothetical protein